MPCALGCLLVVDAATSMRNIAVVDHIVYMASIARCAAWNAAGKMYSGGKKFREFLNNMKT